MATPNEELKAFSVFLTELEDGRLHDELTREVAKLVHAMRNASHEIGASATGALKLTVAFKLKDGIVEAVAAYELKHPRKPRSRSIFWPTEANGLSRTNPRQASLPFGVVQMPETRSAIGARHDHDPITGEVIE